MRFILLQLLWLFQTKPLLSTHGFQPKTQRKPVTLSRDSPPTLRLKLTLTIITATMITTAITMSLSLPVAYKNANPAQPFELVVDLVGRPKYGTFDPTTFIMITLPLIYGLSSWRLWLRIRHRITCFVGCALFLLQRTPMGKKRNHSTHVNGVSGACVWGIPIR